ncbi:MAG: L-ascorbate metabolism protein UlaG, beta-lactamase superfamily, partial [Pseudonocardiales bacterium]|nr:L-ascorbate metabolism protein UlaG, beta-lactamase superfamily [Pseudonocardiales bacterium]
CSLQFIGTATMLLKLGPFTLLTDPNFLHKGQRAYLGHGLTSKRRTEPAIDIEQVPELTAVILSHMHGDHWDRVAKRGLPRDVPVLTTSKAAKALRRQGFRAPRAMTTWSSQSFKTEDCTLTVTATPGRHGTGIARHLLPPVMGSVLDFSGADAQTLRLYITGDTLFVDDLRAVPQRFPSIDVAALHLGGTRLPGGLLVTMDAEQGADLLELVQPRLAIPIHNDDYGVFKSPLSEFLEVVQARGLTEHVRVVKPGQTIELLNP